MSRKPSLVEETNLGLYVWMMPDGKLMGDDGGRYLSIASKKGDRKRIEQITATAHDHLKNMGLQSEGSAYFMSGHRKITDEEFEEQLDRQRNGLIPDPYDIAAMKETLRHEGEFNK